MYRPMMIAGVGILIVLSVVLSALDAPALAYDRYSQNGGDATNCGTCHGDYRADNYQSRTDGTNWGNLHNLHRYTMLSGDCDVCHVSSDEFPVYLSQSAGGDGMAAISCVGCHGNAENNSPDNPDWPQSGYGAGLRQHHHNAGVTSCAGCHDDASPANFTPAPEGTLPVYYADPGNGHPMIPTDACNQDGSENFAGAPEGLDNDGDLLYDGADGDCSSTAAPDGPAARSLLAQNHPNPFNPETVIGYSLAEPGRARLVVYTVDGEVVRTLVDSHHDRAAAYTVRWHGRDDAGNPVASGVYFYRLETATASVTKKMVLAR
jgi:cytochrome c553